MMIPVQNTKLEHFSSLNSCFYFIFSSLHQTKVFSSEKKNLYVWVSIYFSWAMVRNSGFLLICTTYSSIGALHICIAYCISCAQSHFGADSTCFCIILNSSSFFFCLVVSIFGCNNCPNTDVTYILQMEMQTKNENTE